MTDTTPNLSFPYLIAAQAQKHVTHNESIRMLDALVHVNVLDRDLSAPPVNPVNGDRYIVSAAPTGAWALQAGNIAAFQDGAWKFYVPREGFTGWVADEDKLVAFNGTAWVFAGVTPLNPTPLVGVNATADLTNRLAVSSPATLLNHAGAGHQVKINKATPADTDSLLFQTGFSGRAEIGLTGDDNLHVKMSADGATWREVITSKAIGGSWQVQLGDVTNGQPSSVALHVGTPLPIPFTAEFTGASGAGAGIVGVATATPTAADHRLGYFIMGSRNNSAALVGSAGTFAFAGEAWTLTSYASYLQFATTPSGSTVRTPRFRVEPAGHFRPEADNAYTLGSASFRLASIWAANGVIQTSDGREKIVDRRIAPAQAGAVVDAIEPVMFRWRSGSQTIESIATSASDPDGIDPVIETRTHSTPGRRLHAGFIAQEVKAALDSQDMVCGVWGLDDTDDADSRQWLRPDQLVALLWAALRETRAELKALANNR